MAQPMEDRSKRRRLFQFLAVLFVVLFMLAVELPVLDYEKWEALAYLRDPTQQNLQALHAKRREEAKIRWLIATPFAVLAIAFAIPLFTRGKRPPLT